jgi:hypothetical protein
LRKLFEMRNYGCATGIVDCCFYCFVLDCCCCVLFVVLSCYHLPHPLTYILLLQLIHRRQRETAIWIVLCWYDFGGFVLMRTFPLLAHHCYFPYF